MYTFSQEQKLAIEAPNKVVRIMAGPGSGKTSVITARIQHLIEKEYIAPSEILSLSFTVKAVEELRQRLSETLGERAQLIQVKTIHALCLSIHIDQLLSEGSGPTICIQDSPKMLTQAIQATLTHLAKDPSFPEEWLYPEALLNIVRQIKQNEPEALLTPSVRHDVQLVQIFDKQLQKTGILTFDDLGPIALKALHTNKDLCTTRQAQHKAIFVDEAQDLNAAQFAILKALAGEHPCLTFVGDDDQCIYAWRGAAPQLLRELESHYSNTLTYTLSTNFRCPSAIVSASSALIVNNSYRFPKALTADSSKDGTAKQQGHTIIVHHDQTAEAELLRVVNQIESAINSGTPPEQIAVLNRHNSRCKQVQLALLIRKLPVVFDNPLITAGGQRLLSLMYVLQEGIESSHFARIIDLGVKRLGKSMLRSIFPTPPPPEELGPFLQNWVSTQPKHPLALLLKTFLDHIHTARAQPKQALSQTWSDLCSALQIPKEPTGLSHEDDIAIAYQTLADLSTRHQNSLVPLPSLLAEAEAYKLGGPTAQMGVHVLSLHRAKGLEFDTVYIMGVQPGVIPTGKSMFQANRLEEERRLLYVGMTRARQHLYLSHYGQQPPALQHMEWQGFLSELPREDIHFIGHIENQITYHV